MKKIKKIKRIIPIILIILITASITYSWKDDFYSSLFRFDNIVKKIRTEYVVDVPAESLITYAVRGMKDVLDPHTTYFKEKDFKEFMIHTNGEFGGLGITIGIRDENLTVIAPMPGCPAIKKGIMAGDHIYKIDSVLTEGITIDKAVDKLRGLKGQAINITIKREGNKEPFEVEIIRDIIKIKMIDHVQMVDTLEKIGYIKLISFGRKTTSELKDAINSLNKDGMKSLILDLRGNPGGLLPQAVSVSDLFLPKGRVITFTKGRTRSSKQNFKTRTKPLLKMNQKLTVLIDGGSASASEIVAGAIKDWDRGVIIGNQSYGKGSVQTVHQLSDEHAFKLTTAHYYSPSGRCINKLSNETELIKRKRKEAKEKRIEEKKLSGKKLLESDTLEQLPVFKTLLSGREVKGEGGITPDIKIKNKPFSRIEFELIKNGYFFKFAIKELAEIRKTKDSIINENFVVTNEIFTKFQEFLSKKEFEYKTSEEKILDNFSELIKKERQDPNDTNKTIEGPNDKEMDKGIKALKETIAKNKIDDFSKNQEELKKLLTTEFLAAAIDKKTVYKYKLKNDIYIKEAFRVLNDKKLYKKIIKKGYTE